MSYDPEAIKAKRPLSPHLSIYRPQISSMLSILHRITGAALHVGMLLFTWIMVYRIYHPEFSIKNCSCSILINIILACFIFALIYHLLNGIRHLFWDIGIGFKVDTLNKSGMFVIIASVIITCIICYLGVNN